MLSRAAKSIAKSISQRKYHVGDENIKLAMIGGTGGIGRNLSQMLKQSTKLDLLALYDVTLLNKRYLTTSNRTHTFNVGESINFEKTKLLTMLNRGEYRNEAMRESANVNQKDTQRLMDNLRCLPIIEEGATDQMTVNRVESQLQPAQQPLTAQQPAANKVFERMSMVPLGIDGSIAVTKDQRNRGPLSMTSNDTYDRSTIASMNDLTARQQQLVHSTAEDRMLMSNGDRTRNDDYFPQGDEYEDEIGVEGGHLIDTPYGRPYREEDLE